MDIAALGVRIDSNGVVQTTRELRDFEGQAGRTEKATDGLSRAFRMLGPLVGTITAAFSVRALVQYADAWSDMSSRVGAAIKDMDAAPTMMKRLVDMANASYSPLEQTVSVYARNVGTLRDLGYAADGAADFTEALNHALVITATRGERAQSVQDALSKAMATGKLQADGLETVLANGGRVAEALAAELGTTVSGLRGMASQGKITGDVIARAMTGRLQELRDEAAEMPATIGDAFVRINNNTTAFIGTLDKAWGVSSRVAEAMLGMADGILGATDTFLRLGNIIGTAVGPAFDLLGSSLGSVTQYAGIAVAALSGFYAPALIGGIGTLATAIGVGVVGAIRAVGVAMMANPLGLLIGGLAAAVTAAFIFRDEIKRAIGVDTVAVMVDVGNKTIGVFVGAYQAVKEQWENLPTLFSAIGKMAWNNFVETFEGPALKINTPWGNVELGGVDLSAAKAELSAAERRSFNRASATFDSSYTSDTYIKGINTAVGELWTNAEGATDAMIGLMDAAGGGVGAGAAGKGKENPYDKIVRGAHDFISAQTLEQQALGMTAEAAARMRYEQDLLNKAANDNIKLTPAMRNELMGLAAQMASVEEATRRVTEIYNFGKDVFGGFFGDLKSGLKEGQSLWEALGNAGLNALDKIADRALSMAIDGIWDMIFGAVMGGFGGNSLGGGWGVAGGFGRPGIFGIPGFADGTNSAPGGLAWVGERGPELVNLPRGSQVYPHQQSMAMAANGNSPKITVNNYGTPQTYQVQSVSRDEVVLIARDAAADAVGQYDEAMPRRVRGLAGNKWQDY